jgi:hypothetical protein
LHVQLVSRSSSTPIQSLQGPRRPRRRRRPRACDAALGVHWHRFVSHRWRTGPGRARSTSTQIRPSTSCRLLLVEVPFPVVRHLPCRPGSRLAERVVLGRGERRALAHLVRPVVVVPVLAGFETRDDPMTRAPGVSTRMLSGRGIATPDVAALGTAPKMKPPATTAGKALDTAITAGRHARVDR